MSDAQVAAFLLARFGGEADALASVGRGEWSKAYGFCRDGTEYIIRFSIRFSPFDEDFEKDRLAARYRSRDLPIPPIIELGRAFDGYYEERLHCYELHIGLSGQAYQAFAGHWDDLDWTARRTLAVAAEAR